MKSFTTILCLLSAMVASAQAPFEQDPLPDGVIVIEAEHFHSSTSVNGKAWADVSGPSLSLGTGMQALPNTGDRIDSNIEAQAPRLDYLVNFTKAGRHYVSVRGIGPAGADDTIHSGLNGVVTTNSDRIGTFSSSVRWRNYTYQTGNPRIYIDVPFPGVHTFSLWMREDGFIVDKILLTTNEYFILENGEGPPESPRQGAGASTEESSEYAATITRMQFNAGQFEIGFEPVPSAQSYHMKDRVDLSGIPDFPVPATVNVFTATFPEDAATARFFAVHAEPMSISNQYAALLMNRIAYGPTPDLIEHVMPHAGGIGGQAFLDEQLSPELLPESVESSLFWNYFNNRLISGISEIDDFQSWSMLRAVEADRQLLEILVQFFDNHFTTYFWETRNWFRNRGYSSTDANRLATRIEYAEHQKWREILLDPNGTFYDLLKVSCESPAMIIYLDTVDSLSNAPNENFSREIKELFCMGVDNGYDQRDIEQMSPAWTGWQVGPVHPDDAGNPHAPLYTNAPVLLDAESTGWWYRKGTSEPEADWNQPGYVMDTNWTGGAQTGIGYGDGDDNTELADMRYTYLTVYLRKEWVIDAGDDTSMLNFQLYVDDGCIVWVNGTEVARFNVNDGAVKAYDDGSDTSVGNALWVRVPSQALSAALTPGTNIIAVHLLNTSLSSSDLSFDMSVAAEPVWSFVFNPSVHANEAKYIFSNKVVDARFGGDYGGQSYELYLPPRSGTNGIADGYDIMEHLANLPYTQEFISKKLCELLVHDQFSFKNYYNISSISDEDALIKACMEAWNTPGPDGRKGNLRAVIRTILESDLFKSQSAIAQKAKTPMEYMASAIRALRADLGGGVYASGTVGLDLVIPMSFSGMSLYQRFTPDGWPEVARKWVDTGNINERLRFIQHFLRADDDPLKSSEYYGTGSYTTSDPVALVMDKLPSPAWTDPGAVTDYFISIIYPGEGPANLGADREECLRLLNSDETGTPGSSPFNLLTPGNTDYDLRVRSLVGLLLSGPRFHEQ